MCRGIAALASIRRRKRRQHRSRISRNRAAESAVHAPRHPCGRASRAFRPKRKLASFGRVGEDGPVVGGLSRDELVSGLVRVGELELTGENQAEVDAYFAPDFKFHGPDGRELDYEG